jgi:hypothetical protein
LNNDFGSAAAAISIAERARALRWLQANADDFLDFGVLEAKERAKWTTSAQSQGKSRPFAVRRQGSAM